MVGKVKFKLHQLWEYFFIRIKNGITVNGFGKLEFLVKSMWNDIDIFNAKFF